MKKIFVVASREFWALVRTWSFFFALLTPVLIGLSMAVFGGIAFLAGGGTRLIQEITSPRIIGIVDHSGILLRGEIEKTASARTEMEFFSDEEKARQALKSRSLSTLYIIPKDYMESGSVDCYTPPIPIPRQKRRLEFEVEYGCRGEALVEKALIAGLTRGRVEESIRKRLLEPMNLRTRPEEESPGNSKEEVSEITKQASSLFISFFLALFFFMNLLMTSSFMFHGFTQEKTSRLLEILLSSVTPFQLMMGKLLGYGGVGFTLIVFWGVLASPIFLLFAAFFPGVIFKPLFLLAAALFYLLGFLFLGCQMLAIATFGETERETNQYLVWIMMPTMLPFMTMQFTLMNPDSTFNRFLSYFPYSAPMTMVLRMGVGTVSVQEISLSLLLLSIFSGTALWLSWKVLRVNTLMYGQRLRLKALLQAFRS